MKKNTFQALALSLALGLSTPLIVHAQTADNAAATTAQAEPGKAERGGKHAHRHHHHQRHAHKKGPRAAMMDPVFSLQRLAPELKLSAEQKTLFDQAQAQQKTAREAVGERFKANREARTQLLKADVIDLRALSEQRQADGQLMRDQHTQVRQAWLAVYDSLNAEQKKTVSDALKKRGEKQARNAPKRDAAS